MEVEIFPYSSGDVAEYLLPCPSPSFQQTYNSDSIPIGESQISNNFF